MRRRGFTVIELVAAMALAAIVSAMSALAASSVATAIHAAASGRMLAQTMRETRARAMAEGAPIDVLFDATTRTWVVRAVGGPVRRTEPLPAPIGFVSLPARARIRFDSNGTAENGTIALGAGSAVCRIVVNQRGRVRLG